ncbi:MAG: acpS [Chitinophagaceae bacterium]|nr:acpS [Chitinophagaceae bacterium]
MIKGLGTDIIAVERVKQKIDKPFGFLEKVYSVAEITVCEGKGKSKYESYAGRFAAKEAFLKAVGISWIDEFNLNEIEILNEPSGKPYLKLSGSAAQWASTTGISKIFLSISHTSEYATATVILEHE